MKIKKILPLVALFLVFCTSLLADASPDQKQTIPGTVKVIVRFAKVRSLPADNGNIIKQIGYGTMLQVVEKSGEFFRVIPLTASSQPVNEAWYIHQGDVEAAIRTADVPPGRENRQVVLEPQQLVVGQPGLFSALNFHTPHLLKWDMGDGTVLTSGSKSAPDQEAKLAYAYAAAGTFMVKVYDDKGNLNLPPITVQVRVDAYPRILKINSEKPMANHPLAITAANFSTPESIMWDLGDGTEIKPGDERGIVKKSFLVSHVYAAAGTYTVKAYDFDGDKSRLPVTLNIQVAADPRAIKVEPEKAVVGVPLQLSALNFNTPSHLRWDMGDGTVLPRENEKNILLGSLVNYSYKKPGEYVIKVYDWDADVERQPVVLTIVIAAEIEAKLLANVPVLSADRTEDTEIPAIPAEKTYLLFRLGPYAGYFQPQDELLKMYYSKGDMIYGGKLGVHIWQGFYFWLSCSQFRVISTTSFTKEKTTLTLIPVSAFLRYSLGWGFFYPYAGVGFTYMSFKEESVIGNTKGNGKNISFEGGIELKINRHFFLDLGVNYNQIKVKPKNTTVEIDLGGLQAGVAFFVSF